jgi:hypothetical protein
MQVHQSERVYCAQIPEFYVNKIDSQGCFELQPLPKETYFQVR